MSHFVVVYDRSKATLVQLSEYSDRSAALRERWACEALHRGERDIEIVVLSADDEHALRSTHGRYFKTVAEMLSR